MKSFSFSRALSFLKTISKEVLAMTMAVAATVTVTLMAC
jgi:hypothetical protein